MTRTLCTLLALTSAVLLDAQVPQAINFQATARDIDGNALAKKIIGLRLTIIDGTDNNKEIYQEEHGATTDHFGLFQVEIGNPNGSVNTLPNSVDFKDIPWYSGQKTLKIEFDTTAAQKFPILLGTVPIVTVPFAFAAQTLVHFRDENAETGDIMVFNGTNWIPTDDTIVINQKIAVNANNSSASSSAALEINADDRGVLIPRVKLDSINGPGPIKAPVEGLLVYNETGNLDKGFWYWTGSRWTRMLNSPSGKKNSGIAVLQQEAPDSTDGGGSLRSIDNWTKRPLNKLYGDSSFVSLDGNGSFTLKPGLYLIEAWASGYSVNSHQVGLFSSTGILLRSGSSEVSDDTWTSTSKSELFYFAKVKSSETYDLRHRVEGYNPDNGGGLGASWAIERYAQIKITKLD